MSQLPLDQNNDRDPGHLCILRKLHTIIEPLPLDFQSKTHLSMRINCQLHPHRKSSLSKLSKNQPIAFFKCLWCYYQTVRINTVGFFIHLVDRKKNKFRPYRQMHSKIPELDSHHIIKPHISNNHFAIQYYIIINIKL